MSSTVEKIASRLFPKCLQKDIFPERSKKANDYLLGLAMKPHMFPQILTRICTYIIKNNDYKH